MFLIFLGSNLDLLLSRLPGELSSWGFYLFSSGLGSLQALSVMFCSSFLFDCGTCLKNTFREGHYVISN